MAEVLDGPLAFGRGAGVDTRWLVLDGDPEFFAITKRIHNPCPGRRTPAPTPPPQGTPTTTGCCNRTWRR